MFGGLHQAPSRLGNYQVPSNSLSNHGSSPFLLSIGSSSGQFRHVLGSVARKAFCFLGFGGTGSRGRYPHPVFWLLLKSLANGWIMFPDGECLTATGCIILVMTCLVEKDDLSVLPCHPTSSIDP